MRVWILLFVVLFVVPARAEYIFGTDVPSYFRGAGSVDTGYQIATIDRPNASTKLAVVNVSSGGVENYSLCWFYAELSVRMRVFSESNRSKVSVSLTSY